MSVTRVRPAVRAEAHLSNADAWPGVVRALATIALPAGHTPAGHTPAGSR